MSADVSEAVQLDKPTPAPELLPPPVPYVPPRAKSLKAALDELCGDYTESRLEQIAYPHTDSARGWRMALRYAIVVVGGAKGMERIKEIHEKYPLPNNLAEF